MPLRTLSQHLCPKWSFPLDKALILDPLQEMSDLIHHWSLLLCLHWPSHLHGHTDLMLLLRLPLVKSVALQGTKGTLHVCVKLCTYIKHFYQDIIPYLLLNDTCCDRIAPFLYTCKQENHVSSKLYSSFTQSLRQMFNIPVACTYMCSFTECMWRPLPKLEIFLLSLNFGKGYPIIRVTNFWRCV